MGTLAVSFGLFVMCVAATPDKPARASSLVAYTGSLAAIVFVARVLGFVVERWGW
jgi:hypothetical protein